MGPDTASLCIALTATGTTAGAGVTKSEIREILRRNKYVEDLRHVATVSAEEFKAVIKTENARKYFQQSLNIFRKLGCTYAKRAESNLKQLPDDE